MRKTFIVLVAAAIAGVAACTSSGRPSSPVAPSVSVPSGNSAVVPNTAYSFSATPFGGGASTWSGITTATSAPNTGHHGLLTVDFMAPFAWGGEATLQWSKFEHGQPATCTITDDKGNPPITLASCEDGEMDVYPSVTTVYTFTDVKNSGNDPPQTLTTTVVVPTTFNVNVRWSSNMGSGDDDPGIVYSGTASGPAGTMALNATSTTRCGLGGNGPASTFTANMTYVDPLHITGTYSGMDCTVDSGTYTLVKQ